ncbi:sigma-70 family RNA polymerase sigma factor [Kineosporia babensis]|uniref:RNA polymerase sigma factor n=1 Tax=Kineosporia babensis TaxID=499548 RepID=A0A9X1NA10_9ACTN|nr:sigma-70 family RNA polymerase sigma factor [Kineosporia babensis]MCD5310298.1 sigma-70 family RNA polymerase sigma factor [Kineosporia babensis]
MPPIAQIPAQSTPPTAVGMTTAEREERFNDIVRTHRPGLIAFTTRLVGGDIGRAEDVVQETFVRAWRRIELLTPEHGSVSSWLRRVAYNVAVDGHRMRKVRPTEVELQHHDAPVRQDGADGTDRVLAEIVVRDMLNSIWPEHRAVLEEVYLKDRTAAEAAAALGIPVGTVKSRLFYALRTLRGNAMESGLRAS